MATANASKEAGTAPNKSSNDIESQIQQLREDIAALASTMAAVGSEKADDYRRKVKRAKSDAADASLQMVEQARDQVLSLEKDLERKIRTNPLQAIAMAAG